MDGFKDGWTKDEIEAAIMGNRPEELLRIPILVSLDPPDCVWAQNVCIRLAGHPHYNVRGNALLGFGHLARTCVKLNEEAVRPLIERGLKDGEEYVRGASGCGGQRRRTLSGVALNEL